MLLAGFFAVSLSNKSRAFEHIKRFHLQRIYVYMYIYVYVYIYIALYLYIYLLNYLEFGCCPLPAVDLLVY